MYETGGHHSQSIASARDSVRRDYFLPVNPAHPVILSNLPPRTTTEVANLANMAKLTGNSGILNGRLPTEVANMAKLTGSSGTPIGRLPKRCGSELVDHNI